MRLTDLPMSDPDEAALRRKIAAWTTGCSPAWRRRKRAIVRKLRAARERSRKS